MADDDRDKYKPKHPTPTGLSTMRPGTPVRGVPTLDVRGHAEELAARERAEFGGETPIDAPTSVVLARIAERTRTASASATDIQTRMHTAEGHLATMKHDIGALALSVAQLNGSVVTLVDEAKEAREERLERERRADKRAETAALQEAELAKQELAFRRDRWLKLAAIIVPTLTAVGAIIAGILGAYR